MADRTESDPGAGSEAQPTQPAAQTKLPLSISPWVAGHSSHKNVASGQGKINLMMRFLAFRLCTCSLH